MVGLETGEATTVTADPVSNARAAAVRGDFESAIDVLRPLAEAGNREAQYELGLLALLRTDCSQQMSPMA